MVPGQGCGPGTIVVTLLRPRGFHGGEAVHAQRAAA